MKRALFFLITVFILCCNKEDISTFIAGDVTAVRNASSSSFGNENTSWIGKTAALHSNPPDSCFNCVDIGLYVESNQGSESLIFTNVPLNVQKCTLNAWDGQSEYKCMGTFNTSSGDVITGFYSVLGGNTEDFIEITELDMALGKFSGRFQATLVRDTNWLVEYPPDTIWITEGEFTATIGE